MRFHNAQTAENARFVGEQLSRENVIVGKVKCESCGYLNTVAVLPWSPQIAKVRCAHQNCGYEFTVHVEARTMGDVIEDAVNEQYARAEQAQAPKGFSTQTSKTRYEEAPILTVKGPSRGSAGASLTPFKHKTMDTPFGKAALL